MRWFFFCGGVGATIKVPELEEGVVYTQVSAGPGHTVFLRSDGTAVASGSKYAYMGLRPCRLPLLAWMTPPLAVQLFIAAADADTIEATCRNLNGDELARWIVLDQTRGIKRSVDEMLSPRSQGCRVVLPDGTLASPRHTWHSVAKQRNKTRQD